MIEPNKSTPTSQLLIHLLGTNNPVTRSVLAEIIGNRIDRALGIGERNRGGGK